MKVIIQNHQKTFRVNSRILRRMSLSLIQRARRLDRAVHWGSIVVHLVDDNGIRIAHQAFFGKDSVTDVISQRYPPLPGEPGTSGEIIVNVQQALRAARRPRWSANQELGLYLAHGIDHLHGANDDTDSTRQRMRRRELRWLSELRQSGFDFSTLGLECP